jgi:hypothetical protein
MGVVRRQSMGPFSCKDAATLYLAQITEALRLSMHYSSFVASMYAFVWGVNRDFKVIALDNKQRVAGQARLLLTSVGTSNNGPKGS